MGKIIYEYSLLDDQKHMLNLLIQELQSFAYDVLIISGDIYDRSIPPLEAISLFDDFLTRVHTKFPN
ncbi:MAG: exonuclease sbcCD subunit D, partial [Spirochaetales bacterium]